MLAPFWQHSISLPSRKAFDHLKVASRSAFTDKPHELIENQSIGGFAQCLIADITPKYSGMTRYTSDHTVLSATKCEPYLPLLLTHCLVLIVLTDGQMARLSCPGEKPAANLSETQMYFAS